MDPVEEDVPWTPPRPLGKRVAIAIGVAVVAVGAIAGFACFRSDVTPTAGPTPKRGCVVQLDEDGYQCARLRDGSVHCWGKDVPSFDGFQGRPRRVTAFTEPAESLFAELGAICVGVRDGSLWCVGSNSHGQLGLPASQTYSTQAQKHHLTGVRELTWRGRCALTREGVRCWENDRASEILISGLPAKVRRLTGGRIFSCVLLENGEVYCRGSNFRGQLGILEGTTDEERARERLQGRDQYTRVASLGNTVRTIASTARHTCAIKADGSVWCWGENQRGQIGKGDVSTKCELKDGQFVCVPEEGLVPHRVQGLPHPMTSLALGETTSCAIDGHGAAWCWGSLPEPTPVARKLDLPEPVTALSLGDEACALFRSGAVRCRSFANPLTDWSDAIELDFGCP